MFLPGAGGLAIQNLIRILRYTKKTRVVRVAVMCLMVRPAFAPVFVPCGPGPACPYRDLTAVFTLKFTRLTHKLGQLYEGSYTL